LQYDPPPFISFLSKAAVAVILWFLEPADIPFDLDEDQPPILHLILEGLIYRDLRRMHI
jgi:hypothetical protein